MWLNKWAGMFVLPLLVAVMAFGLWLLWVVTTDSARLHPDRRVVEVREVDNGYVVSYRTANNPYPVKEAVAKDSDEAAWQVQQYLKQAIPASAWGK